MKSVEKGKKLFLSMVIAILAVSIVTTAFSYFMQGNIGIISGLTRTVVEAILLYFIFKGKAWAKIIMIILLIIVILAAVAAIMISPNIMITMLMIVYIFSVYIIGISPSVKEYLKSSNNK
ncbi:hypothetical protein [Clostridium beijerinckii]|jgi:hypothetical protein|uniref:Uncharacterized protein n=2 Tax=Clostridium beijerinckii TaxID=1520 RepID=A0AAW3WBB1_CLOBE|nr:hypothetical protein [Clostridium beijerinckii]MBC2458398.1 hypothetical protein [Clostridium beijerinckii]MBC2475763.1 hypothetical protein [Clostridium beijerinckii]MCI1577799.1 hypothetical protein [Clostridium beijerinckii]MCI1584598.1 hypothetical protein [Clostridium beijerinckii]MCI1624033.1 hypothetical protein [Clostridium beijerinckii]